MAAEVTKARLHRGRQPALSHFRQVRGVEVDLVLEHGTRLGLIGAKSGATVPPDFQTPLTLASDLLAEEDKAIDKGISPFLEAQGLEEADATRFGAILASGGGILEVSAVSGEASHRQILDVLESQNHSRYVVVDVE